MPEKNKVIYCQRCGARCCEIQDGEFKRLACANCGYIYYKNPYPCVSVLVADDDGNIIR